MGGKRTEFHPLGSRLLLPHRGWTSQCQGRPGAIISDMFFFHATRRHDTPQAFPSLFCILFFIFISIFSFISHERLNCISSSCRNVPRRNVHVRPCTGRLRQRIRLCHRDEIHHSIPLPHSVHTTTKPYYALGLDLILALCSLSDANNNFCISAITTRTLAAHHHRHWQSRLQYHWPPPKMMLPPLGASSPESNDRSLQRLRERQEQRERRQKIKDELERIRRGSQSSSTPPPPPSSPAAPPTPDEQLNAELAKAAQDAETSNNGQNDGHNDGQNDGRENGPGFWGYLLGAFAIVLVLIFVRDIPAWLRPPPSSAPDPAMCFLVDGSSDPLKLHTPAGLYPPLNAMAVTFASTPNAALRWIEGGFMPITWPHIDSLSPSESIFVELERRLRLALRQELSFDDRHHGRPGPLRLWWRRQSKPAVGSAAISRHLRQIREVQSWSSVHRFWTCTLPGSSHPACAARTQENDLVASLRPVLNVTALAEKTCAQSQRDAVVHGLDTAFSLDHVQKMKRAVYDAVAQIALDEAELVDRAVRVRAKSALPLQTAASTAAPWSPRATNFAGSPVAGRNHRTFFLSQASYVYGIEVPSPAAQEQLHRLSAFQAQALWAEFVISALHRYQSSVAELCKDVLTQSNLAEHDAFQVLKDMIRREQPVSRLNMTAFAGQMLTVAESTLADNTDLLQLLEPLSEGYKGNDSRFGRTKHGEGPRSPAEKLFRHYLLAQQLSPPSSSDHHLEAQHSCLVNVAAQQFSSSRSHASSAAPLAMAAVWEFWHNGASPMWMTKDLVDDSDGQGGVRYRPGRPGDGRVDMDNARRAA